MPTYEPLRWNVLPSQLLNNCYNYALDDDDGSYRHPGEKSSGNKLAAADFANGALVAKRAIDDGLVPVSRPTGHPDRYPVALVIMPPGLHPLAPDGDFHWYRLDDDTKRWSHKQGGGAATDRDLANRVIQDPFFCNRGPYLHFVGYFEVPRPLRAGRP